MNDEFLPVLYVKAGCPHCFKLRLFLLETGLIDRFLLREWEPGDDKEAAIKQELSEHFEKVTFPVVQYAPGKFQNESDTLVARYAEQAGKDLAELPLYQVWVTRIQPRLRTLSAENKALKAAAGLD